MLTFAATLKRPETQYDLAVVSEQNPYRFTFQHVDDDGNLYGDPFTEDICRTYASPEGDFLKGVIIKKIIYGVDSGCWSLNPNAHEGYYFRWNEKREPVFAKGVQ